MLAFVVLVEGALLYGCAAAPAIVLPVESLDPPNNCILDIRDKDSQLKEVLCQLEKLADSLQDPAIPNAVSLELEVCFLPMLECMHLCGCDTTHPLSIDMCTWCGDSQAQPLHESV